MLRKRLRPNGWHLSASNSTLVVLFVYADSRWMVIVEWWWIKSIIHRGIISREATSVVKLIPIDHNSHPSQFVLDSISISYIYRLDRQSASIFLPNVTSTGCPEIAFDIFSFPLSCTLLASPSNHSVVRSNARGFICDIRIPIDQFPR